MSETDRNPRKSVASPARSSVPVVRELQHPERRLTLLMVSTALLFGFIGTVLGAFTLAHLSGVPTDLGLGFFPSHPFLQIYGFIGEFVVGVAYSLLPRFKIIQVPEMTLGFLTYGLITCANALFLLLPGLVLYNSILGPIAALLLLGGSLIFASQVFFLASRRAGGFPETNPLMALSSLSLVLISLMLFFKESSIVNIGSEIFSPQMIFLALLGFAGSMIYTVETRSVSFRQCNYRRRFANLSWKLQAGAIATTFVSLFLSGDSSFLLSIIGGGLFLAGALCVIASIRIFELAHPLMYRPAMTKTHFKIVRYNEVCILSGSSWLIFGCAVGIIFLFGQYPNAFLFFLRDSFIHSVAIGFIGSTITVFAPMLLPSLLGRRAPISGLSFGPIILLNTGIFLRVLGVSTTIFSSSSLPIWESASGPLILGAMIWLLLVLPRIGKQAQLKTVFAKATAAENPVEAIKNERDAVITVNQTETNISIKINVWFAEKDGEIYLLPSKGAQTKWYHHVLSNPNLNLLIASRNFSGKAQVLEEKKAVNSAVQLFKDKYGDRVFKNFYDGRVNRAVKVSAIQKTNA